MYLYIPTREILEQTCHILIVDVSVSVNVECLFTNLNVPSGKVLEQTRSILVIQLSVIINITGNIFNNVKYTALSVIGYVFLQNVIYIFRII